MVGPRKRGVRIRVIRIRVRRRRMIRSIRPWLVAIRVDRRRNSNYLTLGMRRRVVRGDSNGVGTSALWH